MRIRLIGLEVKKPGYNGKEAIIVGNYIKEKGRWPVKIIFNGKKANIKPENLESIKMSVVYKNMFNEYMPKAKQYSK